MINHTTAARIRQTGQVFTNQQVVTRMLALRKNHGSVLEPSCGKGAFMHQLEASAVGIECDDDLARLSPGPIHIMDFFDYPTTHRFDTIIGNPPYVRHRDIQPSTKDLLTSQRLNRRSNLYLYFIEKCIYHLNPGGELIFITPRDFIHLTSAAPLNQWLNTLGSFTHFDDLGDSSIFGPYTPNCAIWRFELSNFDRRLDNNKTYKIQNGQIFFAKEHGALSLGDLCQIKVGAVSGADPIFTNDAIGNTDFVYARTAQTQQTRRMLYAVYHKALQPYKQQLLKRRVRTFDETNWWQWGRRYYESTAPRIYVNTKTRNPKPFFIHPALAYDGSILACFARKRLNLKKLCADLNALVQWQDLGFVCDGRYLFSQRSLENVPLPSYFKRYA